MNAQVYPLTIYYDGACQLCDSEMTNLKLRNVEQKLRFVDISKVGAAGLPAGLSWDEAMRLIQAQRADGRIIHSVEVFRMAYEAVGLGWATNWTRLPVLGALVDKLYPWVARNRNRFPRVVTHVLFGKALRRAATKAAARRCDDGVCEL
ncbi:MAG: thiol-disulfide oxidoreductase DCC family protein [Formosimonas sp.]